MSSSYRPRRVGVLLGLVALAGSAWLGAVGASARTNDRAPAHGPSSGSDRLARSEEASLRYTVGVARCTFRDASRTTYDYATGAPVPGRVLVTEIRYPVLADGSTTATEQGAVSGAAPAYRRGPFPTVFFAPGYDLTPDDYSALLDAWVRAGFVVVGVSFPDTNPTAVAAARTGDPEDDDVNQPGDMAFVVRRALEASGSRQGDCPMLEGLVEPTELAMAGQSDGADTVATLSYDRAPVYAAPDAGLRIRADVVMSGSELGDTGPYEATIGDPALLVVQSSTDQCNPPQSSAALYDAVVQRDRWFLDLSHADHLPPYDGDDPAGFSVVARVTTRFLLLELHAKVPAAGFLAFGDEAPSVASLTTGPEAPPLPSLAFDGASCYLA